MLQVAKISKSFTKSSPVVKNFSIKIKNAEFIALKGPSGVGKTTILNMLGTLLSPDSGEILFEGEDLTKIRGKKLANFRNKQLGFIFQDFMLEPYLNVLENVLLPTYFGKTRNKSAIKRAKSLLNTVGLKEKYYAKIDEISGGQKQRVAIARALINKPKLIIADEPTGSLDKKTGSQIIKLLKKLQKEEKVSLIVATHDDEVTKVADKIYDL
jgi:putative ABC transport system ATP-binding protein